MDQIERERFVFALIFAAANNDHEGLRALHEDVRAMDREQIESLLMSLALCFGDVLRGPGVDANSTLAQWGAELAARAAGDPS